MVHSVEFQELYRVYQPKILRYLARLVDSTEAEDLTQIVFLKVAQGLSSFRGESSVATWIFRIATNVAFDCLRSRNDDASTLVARQAPSIAGKDEDESEARAEIGTASVEGESIRSEMSHCIKQFIGELPKDYRTVLVLSEIEGFKDKEIAAIVGASLTTVKIRLHRARTELRNRLECGCDFYRDERNELACDRKPVVDFAPVRRLYPFGVDPRLHEKNEVSDKFELPKRSGARPTPDA